MHFFTKNDVNFLYFFKFLPATYWQELPLKIGLVLSERKTGHMWSYQRQIKHQGSEIEVYNFKTLSHFESTNHIPIYGRAASVAHAFVRNNKKETSVRGEERYWYWFTRVYTSHKLHVYRKNLKDTKKHFISVKKLMAFKIKKEDWK